LADRGLDFGEYLIPAWGLTDQPILIKIYQPIILKAITSSFDVVLMESGAQRAIDRE
jgi:hypothetical protein